MNSRIFLCLIPAFILAGCSHLSDLNGPGTSHAPSADVLSPKSGSPFLTLDAKGYQYFRCTVDARGGYWKFERPEAKLTNSAGETVAELSGPMQAFDHSDGSRIISSHITAWVNPANPAVDNKLALLQAVSDDREGVFKGVRYIQRLDTVGGMPQGSCTQPDNGKLQKVPFSAKFVFWK